MQTLLFSQFSFHFSDVQLSLLYAILLILSSPSLNSLLSFYISFNSLLPFFQFSSFYISFNSLISFPFLILFFYFFSSSSFSFLIFFFSFPPPANLCKLFFSSIFLLNFLNELSLLYAHLGCYTYSVLAEVLSGFFKCFSFFLVTFLKF